MISSKNSFTPSVSLTRPRGYLSRCILQGLADRLYNAGHIAHTFFSLVGKLFFFRDVSFEINFEEFESNDADPNGHIRFGKMTHHENGTIGITIDTGDHSQAMELVDHKIALLSTLFQMTINAFFSKFCCGNIMYDERAACQCGQENNKTCGEPGHFAWCFLAAGIEINAQKLLDLKIDLGVFRSLLDESAQKFIAEDWERFFRQYDWEDVDSLIQQLQEEEFDRLGKMLAEEEPGVIEVFMWWYRDYEIQLVNESNRHALRILRAKRRIERKLEYCKNL